MTLRQGWFWLCLLAVSGSASAEVTYVINGVSSDIRQNILSYVDVVQFGREARLSTRDLDRILDDAVAEATNALRPYGYYDPDIAARYVRRDTGNAVLELNIDPGPAIRITAMTLAVEGPGRTSRGLVSWQDEWPLPVGSVLNQVAWEDQKRQGLDRAHAAGYLGARFTEHSLELDLDSRTATARLVMNTGVRWVMGQVDYGEHVLAPGVVENAARFDAGDPYTARLMDNFRLDLWKTGYFTDVEVREQRVAGTEPPTVNLRVSLETETRSRYQGALGFGTDTRIRAQVNYSRQPMSRRGDRLDLGMGWQELDDEFRMVGTYRLPRRDRRREYWVPQATLKFENQDLEFKREDDDTDFIRLANGDLEERHFRFGRLKVHNLKGGDKQLFVTPFVQYLNSKRRFALVDPDNLNVRDADDPAFDRLLTGTDDALSFGIDLDAVAVVGKRFETRGHRERAWLFLGNNALGGEFDFWQAYVSTRRSYLYGNRWKLLLRAEAGYTDAKVDDVVIEDAGGALGLSVTRLPNFYRFKAGGSSSVRGYGFEQLSNNNVGSNNIATASAEIELKVLPNWSAAVFADIGNAFNDWSDPDLKLGIGFGVRWYSIAGPIRVDIAQAVDFDGKPWRLHFTMGTPLL